MNTEDLTFAMEDRLDAYASSGDAAVLQGPEAQRLADKLYYAVDWLSPLSEPAETARAFNVAALLGTFHWYRFEHDGTRADVRRAVLCFQLVHPVAPHCVPEAFRTVYATSGLPAGDGLDERELAAYTATAVNLLKAAERNGDVHLLDDAVELCMFSARANPRQDVVRAEALVTLGNVLTRRYEYTGNPDSLDRAVVVTVKGGEMIPEGHPYRLAFCSGLGHAFIRRFQRTGDLDILDLAVGMLREAAYEAPDDHPHRAAFLTNLSTALSHYHWHTGRTETADEALAARHEAVRITPRDHPDLPSRLLNLAAMLESHPELLPTGAEAVFDAETNGQGPVVALLRDALSLAGDGHPDRPACLHLLASALRERFAREGCQRDLEDAVEAARSAITAAPTNAYERPMFLRELAQSLRRYAAHFSAPGALTKAVEALQEADALLPENHPERSVTLADLGFALADLAETTGASEDRSAALRALHDASLVSSASAHARARAAAAAGHLAASTGNYTEALDHFTLALEQLELTAWRGLERDDRERLIAEYPSLATDAAAVALRAEQPQRAVELLEQGRGILLAQVLESRTDHVDVRAKAPKLADRLRQVLDELDQLPDGSQSSSGAATLDVWERRRVGERRVALARIREEILAEIRALPKLGHFLCAPAFATVRTAAAQGPVVLLVPSQYGCSALLLTGDGVRALPLALDDQQLAARTLTFTQALSDWRSPLEARKEIIDTLSWLWKTVAKPVLTTLGYTEPLGADAAGPRVWWCPAGLFTLLPLHAAGRFLQGGEGDTVPDRVISSYTPTLRTLLHVRERHCAAAGGRAGGLIVSLPSTPGWPDLPAAGEEARALRRRHLNVEFLTGAAATGPAVLDALSRCSWAHFACHGEQDLARPSRGALILHDGPLSLRAITNLRLTRAEFAFLSACETHRGSIILADEAITFATALQLAGFRDVVGTLWPIDDAFAAKVADLVHDHLLQPEPPDPATALHTALRTLHEQRPQAVLSWAPYVHVGP
ncbi:CHAT domain-containing protein [Streptomyces sp. NPDC006368]|uniref:CHAT domain-containing protein n=1 Tax=Streptomyces sp. NPDC006368 TaxID=3156760 RepID=UPI0033A8F5F3